MSTNENLPEAEFEFFDTGIRVKSQHFIEPFFIPFDLIGVCPKCHSTEGNNNFIITRQGLILYSTRIKGSRFLPFSSSLPSLPKHCVFKVQNKGRTYNVHFDNIEEQQKSVDMVGPVSSPPTPKFDINDLEEFFKAINSDPENGE